MDYSDLGLNDQLRAVNSLAGGTTQAIQPLEFESNYQIPTGFIDHANIKDFNFSQGSGGTLTLGGTLNGDGVLSVLNNSGNTVVSLNNTGLTVSNGSITLNGSNGNAIIDSSGIVSTFNFINNTQEIVGTPQIITGTTALNNSTISVTADRNSYVLILASIDAYLTETFPTDTCNVNVDIMQGTSTAISGIRMDSGNNNGRTYTAYKILTVPSGTTNFSMRAKVIPYAGTPSLYVAASKLSYIKLGN